MPHVRADTSIQRQLYEGLEKESEGDCLAAIFIFQDVLDVNPYFLDAKIALARCLFKVGNLKESEALLLEALQQERNNVNVRNLLGKVFISLQKYGEAEQILKEALEIEPANIETRYRLADLYRAMGDYKRAIAIYEKILKIYPQETWTYIHLGNSYTEIRELERAGGFFRKAVSLDSLNPWTHINLARHYYQMGVKYSESDQNASVKFLDASAYEARTALEIEQRLPEAYRILASIDFYNKNYEKAIDSLERIVKLSGDSYVLLYEIGFCHEMRENSEKAREYYAKALAKRIDDEVTRFRLENMVLEIHGSSLSEATRLELADYHLVKARFYYERNVMNKAFLQYKRAIQLDPLDPKKRLELAELLKRRNFYELYLYELREIIRDTLDVNTIDINDKIEIFENRISKNLASRWRVKQYQEDENEPGYIPRTKISVAVFDGFLSDEIYENFLHRRFSKTLSEMLALVLSSYQKIEVVELFSEVRNRHEALKRARSLGVDYYITGEVEEKEDSLKVKLDLYSGFNGKIWRSYETYFTGNEKVFHTVVALADHINSDLSLRGLIVRMEGDRVLINIGEAHGVQKEMQFHIIREGSLKLNPETGEYVIDPSVALGNLTITEVDETVSEGVYTYEGLYNRVNVYDNVVVKEEEQKKETHR